MTEIIWDRKVDILGNTLVLDMLNLEIENTNRLPKYILLRQVYWGKGDERRASQEFYIEWMQQGGIGPMTSAKHMASQAAESLGHSHLFTLVELGWYEDEMALKGPYVHDILVFDENGHYTDSHQRQVAAVRLAREQAAAS